MTMSYITQAVVFRKRWFVTSTVRL